MKKNEVKVGIIGCGHAGYVHTECLTRNPNAVLASVCDLDENQARTLAEKFNISNFYTNVSEMLEKEKLDAVHIITPPNTHSDLAIMAMDANCHVLVEKPMTLELSEADKMIKKSTEKDVKLSVIHNDLFRPVMEKTMTLVKRGEIGTVTSVSVLWGWAPSLWWYENWWFKLRGGRFGENISHILCLLLPFIGEVVFVEAFAKQIEGVSKLPGVSQFPFDELQVILAGNNSLASISMTMNTPRACHLYISGTKSTLRVELSRIIDEGIFRIPVPGSAPSYNHTISSLISRSRYARHVLNFTRRFRYERALKPDVIKYPKDPTLPQYVSSGHYQQIAAFVRCILEDKDPPVTPAEAREVVKVEQMIWDAVDRSFGYNMD